MTGGLMSYYLPVEETTGKPKPDAVPSLYLRQDLHSRWSQPDSDGNPTRLPRGIAAETFWKKFYDRVMELLRKMELSDLIVLMGNKKAQHLDVCLNEPVQFGTYDQKHRLKGLPNKERSPQFKTSPWTQQRSRMKPETLAKIEKQRPDEMLVIPGTDVHVYTAFYDNTPDSPCPGKRILGDWTPMKRFCYNSERIANASHQFARIMARQRIQGPKLVFNPSKGLDGEIQSQPDRVVFTGYNQTVRDGSMSEAEMEQEKRKRLEDADELGFTHGGTELELPAPDTDMAPPPITKHHRNNRQQCTAMPNYTYNTNDADADDDIAALGLQDEYESSRV